MQFAIIAQIQTGSAKAILLAALFSSLTVRTSDAGDVHTLILDLPAPTLKGTPEDLPVGPNIEPYPTKPPPPFHVPPGVRNFAAGRIVTSSDKPSSGTLSQLTDGKKEAFDFDTVEMKKGLHWVQVDLGEPRLVFAIVMWHDHRYTQIMQDVVVQVSNDPEFQKEVITLFNNDADNSSGLGVGPDREYFETHYGKIVAGKGMKTRYVRCHANGSNLSRVSGWQELEVYGLPTDDNRGDTIPSVADITAKDTEPLRVKLPAPALK